MATSIALRSLTRRGLHTPSSTLCCKWVTTGDVKTPWNSMWNRRFRSKPDDNISSAKTEANSKKTSVTSQEKKVYKYNDFSTMDRFGFSSSLGFVLIKSKQDFTFSLDRVVNDCTPAMFYFTANWCGPSQKISPILKNIGYKYHVTTYLVDIDREELQQKLSEFNIKAVPTILFYQDGKLADKMVGADDAQLNQVVGSLYRRRWR